MILSNDTDFLRHHDDFDHAGILIYDDQTPPVTSFVGAIRRIERFVPEESLAGNVVWLDEWME